MISDNKQKKYANGFQLMKSKLNIKTEPNQEELLKNWSDRWQKQNLYNKILLFPQNSL